MSNVPIVVGGIYRVKYDNMRNVKAGDLCVLMVDDESMTPRFHNPNWTSSTKWLRVEGVEFIGVLDIAT